MADPAQATEQPGLSRRAQHGEPAHAAQVSSPVVAQWPCSQLTIGGGVAIFHVASARVVLCRHARAGYWFLPKGRRDVGETSEQGAEREGYEESGYRNRLLPLPLAHRQPTPAVPASGMGDAPLYVTEPVWTMMMPLSAVNQYLLFWYIAETVPPQVEEALNAQEVAASASSEGQPAPYQYPPRYPADLSFRERAKQEPEGYEPVRHAGTGVDEDEAQYESYLLPIDEAMKKLKGSVQADVIGKGWKAIELRRDIEEGRARVEHSRGKLEVVQLTASG